jgi:hypothetical protein
MQLAINSNSCSVAFKAAAEAANFPAAHAPDAARKLLLTAATRGHTKAVHRLLQCHPVQQHLDAATVENMIAPRIASNDPDGFKMICKFTAPQQLDSAAVARLLQVALQQGRQVFVGCLLALPAAEQFSADMVSQLLLAAVEHNRDGSHRTWIQQLSGLPPARQLSSDSVAQLLLAAVKHAPGSVQWLCQLPAAQQVSSTAFEAALDAAVRSEYHVLSENMVQLRLMELPAAGQLSIGALVRLLDSAMACKFSGQNMKQLLRHPVAEQLTTDMVAQLLQTAVKQRVSTLCYGTAYLCALPAAAQISADVLPQLLQSGLTTWAETYGVFYSALGGSCSVSYLCQLPSAQLLSSDAAAQLLLQAAAA